MHKKKLLTIRRHIELEDYLKRHFPKGKTIREVITLFFEKTNDLNDIEYLIDAYMMPIEEINKALDYYDSHSVLDKPDEMLFIQALADKHGVDTSKIIKRIQDLRGINTIKKAGFKVKKRKKYEK